VKLVLTQPTLRRVCRCGTESGGLCCCDLQQLVGISESKFGPFTRLAEAPAYLICCGEKQVATSLSLTGNFVIIIIIIIIIITTKCISYSDNGRQMQGEFCWHTSVGYICYYL
jgi:hypothetical protein